MQNGWQDSGWWSTESRPGGKKLQHHRTVMPVSGLTWILYLVMQELFLYPGTCMNKISIPSALEIFSLPEVHPAIPLLWKTSWKIIPNPVPCYGM